MADKYGILGPDGRIEISKEVLDQLGAIPGWRYGQRIVDGRPEIYFFPPKHNRSLAGALKKYIDPALAAELDGLSWAEIKEQAMIAMGEERAARLDEIAEMGTFHQWIEVGNPANGEFQWVNALVDTGASHSSVGYGLQNDAGIAADPDAAPVAKGRIGSQVSR